MSFWSASERRGVAARCWSGWSGWSASMLCRWLAGLAGLVGLLRQFDLLILLAILTKVFWIFVRAVSPRFVGFAGLTC
eukprot:5573465-Pyramimonas_sp.AAC.1